MRTKSILMASVALMLLFAASIISYPRLAVEHAEPCRNCHFNPAGAGARTEYGNSTTALNELTLQATKKLIVKEYRKPRIGDALIVGFDTRYQVLQTGNSVRL